MLIRIFWCRQCQAANHIIPLYFRYPSDNGFSVAIRRMIFVSAGQGREEKLKEGGGGTKGGGANIEKIFSFL